MSTKKQYKMLVIVDMQRDFIDGALPSKEAEVIVPGIINEIENGDYDEVVFTADIHGKDYSKTQEGRLLPIPHCIEGTEGSRIDSGILGAAFSKYYASQLDYYTSPRIFQKNTFGSVNLGRYLDDRASMGSLRVTFVGTRTDICVISNVLLAKAYVPEAIIEVIPDLCAGCRPELDKAALDVLTSCQVHFAQPSQKKGE